MPADYAVQLLVPGFSFTGSEYIQKTTPTSLPVGSPVALTIEAWARVATAVAAGSLRSAAGFGALAASAIDLRVNGTTGAWELMGANGVTLQGSAFTVGSWAHVAGVFTGSIGNLYLNGVLVASGAMFNTGSIVALDHGRRADGLNYW